MKTLTLVVCGLACAAISSEVQALDWFGSSCDFEKKIEKSLDADGATAIEIIVFAGELSVTGVSGGSEIDVKADACSEEESLLDRTDVALYRAGDLIQIAVDIDRTNEESSDRGWVNTIVDVYVTVPSDIPVSIQDSSGGMKIVGLHSVSVGDSSGDIEIEKIQYDVLIRHDSSGDIDIREVGDILIETDSSGEIYVNDAASLLIKSDSSGGIRARGISGDVTVGIDSSGSISVDDVGGDFLVGNDSSGSIDYDKVQGKVKLPRHKQDD